MQFARLIDAPDRAGAISAAAAAARQGCSRGWLLAGEGRVGPEELLGDVVLALPLVLQLDPRESGELPPDDQWQIAVAADSGWSDSLGAMIGTRARRAWLICPDVGSVASAARRGVGALLPQLVDLDAAAEQVAEYEGELSAESARAISAVNACCAYLLELPETLEEAVGQVERLRQAGVDEVVLQGPAVADDELVAALIGEFDDEEVRRDAEQKLRRLEPAVEKLRAAGGKPPKKPGRSARARQSADESAGGGGDSVADRFVRRLSDRQLTALLGSRPGMRLLFRTMARRYRPGEFVGALEFTLSGAKRSETWTLHCDEQGARARREAAPDAKLHVEAAVADFVRVGLGHVAAPGAVIGGKLNVRGNFALALQLQQMFN